MGVALVVRWYYVTSEEKRSMKNQIKPVNNGKFNNAQSEKGGRKSGISYLNMEDMLSDLGSIRDPNDDGSASTVSTVTSSSTSDDSSSDSSVSIHTDDITISSGTNM